MSTFVQASSESCPTTLSKVNRRSANFHPGIWGDKFLEYANAKPDVETAKSVQQLKEEVKQMLVVAADDPQKQMNLIDDMQRLGVSYHFEVEIGKALHHLNDMYQEFCDSRNEGDLHTVALCFRLLRQHGHNVSSGVFRKFTDNKGKFKEYLSKDSRGLLSLYEAAHLRVHGEDILEEALSFTTSHLEHLKSQLGNPLGPQITHALKFPMHKALPRPQAKHYISLYQEDESRNKVLLNFAKLDFNFLQKLHQEELSHITRWWRDLNFTKRLPFARDRVVECYFWALGMYFEAQYAVARRIIAKTVAMTSIIDDIYDVYGTLEEVVLLTEAIQRWDISALDQLPEYMKVAYQALLDHYSEMEEELEKAGRPLHPVQYSKDMYKALVKAYLVEAKWCHESYVPTVEEYMQVSLVSAAYPMLTSTSFVGMGDLATKETCAWVTKDPLIVRASSTICRLSDDIVGHEFEQERGHVASVVECYMKEHGVSKQEVYSEFRKRITNAWKDMNQECLHPTAVPMPLLTRIFNLARVINFLYEDEDCYTNSTTKTKDFIISVLIDPVPM